MNTKSFRTPCLRAAARVGLFGMCLWVAACASERDHFYVLNILPETPSASASVPAIHVLLSVNVPSLVDRAEMVVSTSHNGIQILDHERWAGILSDQILQTLARDIEKQRTDILVGDRGFDQASAQPVTIRVDIVHMDATPGGTATLEAHWRVLDASTGVDMIGAEVFTAPLKTADYASIASGYSVTLGALAARLASQVHR